MHLECTHYLEMLFLILSGFCTYFCCLVEDVENYILSIWAENEGVNFSFLTDQSVMSFEKNLFSKELVTLSSVLKPWEGIRDF